ncbi:hypothetical protein JKA74_20075 [Marivirga sp. S37H4]|uniref:Uncharacterized protein n=1 Tax=Marivirga aurantiaca TaxID=2802615 RepID=A0A934X2M8_9BACT|nr:hypothetical protein [Marivirga aurantiaca]MBK6267351.1 hypothetical protein [Marivirga aurantiaca]
MSANQIIPGIHNWCDRWCEKCPFIKRCAVGKQELEILNKDGKDNDPEFWPKIGEQLSRTLDLLKDVAIEKGINLDNIPQEEWDEIQNESEQQWAEAEAHPISAIGLEYYKLANQEIGLGFIRDKLQSELRNLELGIDKKTTENIQQLKDGLDVIKWYMYFLPAKCQRLAMERLDKDMEEEFPPEERSYNGTAKITLIGIERSVAAWGMLLEKIPEAEDGILSVLVLLQKLQRLIQVEFPDAEKFIRPGFDE